MNEFSLPRHLADQLVSPAALPINNELPYIPEGTDTVIVDTEAELLCHDVVVVVFKSNPKLFFIRKLGLAIAPRHLWKSGPNDDFGCMAAFTTRGETEKYELVDIEAIQSLWKICYWRDADGEFHTMYSNASEAA